MYGLSYVPSMPLTFCSSIFEGVEVSLGFWALEIAVTLFVLFLRAFAGSLAASCIFKFEMSAIVKRFSPM